MDSKQMKYEPARHVQWNPPPNWSAKFCIDCKNIFEDKIETNRCPKCSKRIKELQNGFKRPTIS